MDIIARGHAGKEREAVAYASGRWTDPAHRCLIPVHAYAEAVGQKGSMTEAWMNVPGESLIAVAGIWRPSAEWGDCYSMIMTEAAGAVITVHTRMPVILASDDHAL